MATGRSSATLVDGDYVEGACWSEGVNEFMSVQSHAALAVGSVIVISHDDEGPRTAAPAALAVYQRIGVVVVASTAADEWITVQTRGFAEALVEATTDITVDDYLEVLAAETAFKLDHATARSTNSVACAVDAATDAGPALATVFLLGDRAIVAAS
ncbi:MAG: hypothetical protein JXP37_07650 [Coriobacteriia bacterium]|nr:hypothetical protein [Coriobacteriia bacterium]